jgi:hypothetical protein
MQAHSVDQAGACDDYRLSRWLVAYSQSRIIITTSRDPVGAPIFYRDVPLMPSPASTEWSQPLAPTAIHLIRWRLRDITKPESHTVLRDMPTCGNCHSFSADGKTFGMDIDGPANDKGLYAVVPVQKHMTIESKDMVHWNPTARSVRSGWIHVAGFTRRPLRGQHLRRAVAQALDSYYVTNFLDYHFLQVFYPTRGILEWYDRATGLRQPLPGADDPKYVQTDGVWSPDGKYIVFARARGPRSPPPGSRRRCMQRSERDANQVRPLPHPVQRRQRRRGPSAFLGASTTA